MNTDTTDIYYRMALEGLRSGGATFARDAFRPAVMQRFIVAVGNPHGVILPARAESVGRIARALRELADDRTAWPNGGIGRALGLWVSDGLMYVDVVDSWPHGGFALRAGRERRQQAIFDSVREVDIRV